MQMRPSRHPRAGDRLGGVANEIEHDLLKLDRVAMEGRQVVGDIERDGNALRRHVRAGERQRIGQELACDRWCWNAAGRGARIRACDCTTPPA